MVFVNLNLIKCGQNYQNSDHGGDYCQYCVYMISMTYCFVDFALKVNDFSTTHLNQPVVLDGI